MSQPREKFRISTREDDKGFRANAYLYEAFLNGVRVEHCHTADEEQGYVELYETDLNGKLIHDKGRKSGLKTIRRYGTVEIKRRKEEAK